MEIPKRTDSNKKKHPLYEVYYSIKRRCYDAKYTRYAYYGARGVTMCDEWRNSYEAFAEWALKNGWEQGLHIDKDKKAYEKGVKGVIYSPEWCSVLTRKENSNYRRNNTFIEYNGQRKTIMQWSEITGIHRTAIHCRLFRYKWSVEKTLTTPKMVRDNFFEYNGERLSAKEWEKRTGLKKDLISHRILKSGWTVEQALTYPIKIGYSRKDLEKHVLNKKHEKMTQCKNQTCQNEVVSIEGRRPKEFCSVECRTKFHNAKNAKGTGRGRPAGSKNKSKKEPTPPPPQEASGGNGEGENNDWSDSLKNAGRGNPEGENIDKQQIWDFSKSPFLVIGDHTEYPESAAPKEWFKRKEWLAEKKVADDKIREAFRLYKAKGGDK